MSTRPRAALLLLSLSVGAVVALSGCSSAGTSATSAPAESAPAKTAPVQSKASACDTLKKSLSTSTETLQTSFGQMGTDPTKAIAGLHTFADAFDSGVSTVGKADVKQAAAKADASLKTMITEVESGMKDPSKGTTAVQAAVTAFQTDFASMAALCK